MSFDVRFWCKTCASEVASLTNLTLGYSANILRVRIPDEVRRHVCERRDAEGRAR
jgi:hypothetical protein